MRLTPACLVPYVLILLPFAQFAKPQQPVSVAFLHSSKPFIVLPVSINGRGPYPLVLDTGSDLTAVDASLFEESGLFLVSNRSEARYFELHIGPKAVMRTFVQGGTPVGNLTEAARDHSNQQK